MKYSSAVTKNLEGFWNARGLGSNLQKKLTRKRLATHFISALGLISTVALLLPAPPVTGHLGKLLTLVSVMYSCPFMSLLMTVPKTIHVRSINFCWNVHSCFVELKNCERMKMVMDKISKLFPHTSKLWNLSP